MLPLSPCRSWWFVRPTSFSILQSLGQRGGGAVRRGWPFYFGITRLCYVSPPAFPPQRLPECRDPRSPLPSALDMINLDLFGPCTPTTIVCCTHRVCCTLIDLVDQQVLLPRRAGKAETSAESNLESWTEGRVGEDLLCRIWKTTDQGTLTSPNHSPEIRPSARAWWARGGDNGGSAYGRCEASPTVSFFLG